MTGRPLATALLVVAAVVGLGAVAAVDPGNPAEGVDRERNGSIVERQPFVGAGGGSGIYLDLPFSVPGGVTVPLPGPLVVLSALAVGLAALWYRSDAEVSLEGVGDDRAGDEPGDVDLSAVGRAAGAAADRIDADADLTNEVYRAWDEMRALVDAGDPETTAPGEFAEAAVAAGMDPDDVAELTELFAEVRYGGRDPADRADRAVAALRRIERAYADGDDGADGGSGQSDGSGTDGGAGREGDGR
ncbi:DUF4129 domain-containing protein [Halosimplex halophilum]|uniref:DUF4129 domain-containing protein n=1 Tax=Halosimplex halophilum TaxID=2559572 RepID=UPI00107FBA53|nr:DUF4129 domain-containing protein [Halosimplex halophilum]